MAVIFTIFKRMGGRLLRILDTTQLPGALPLHKSAHSFPKRPPTAQQFPCSRVPDAHVRGGLEELALGVDADWGFFGAVFLGFAQPE